MGKSEATGARTEIRRTILSGLIYIPVFLILLLLLAAATEKEWLQQGREAVCGIVCLFLTAVLCGAASARKKNSKKIMYGLLGTSCLGIFVIFLGVFTKESSVFNISLLCDLLSVIFGGFAGSMIAASGKKRRPSRKR